MKTLLIIFTVLISASAFPSEKGGSDTFNAIVSYHMSAQYHYEGCQLQVNDQVSATKAVCKAFGDTYLEMTNPNESKESIPSAILGGHQLMFYRTCCLDSEDYHE